MLVQIGGGLAPSLSKVPPKDVGTPRKALLYVEHKCNLKCKHCYESEDTHPTTSRLSLEQYKDIFKQLREMGVLYLNITGGEVFLRRDILDLVAEARRQRFWVKLLTSGYHLNEARAKRIKELKLGQVEISLYSPKEEVHDAFTQIPGSYKRTTNGIKLLVAQGVRTVVKTNIMTFNVDDLEDLKGWTESVGAEFMMSTAVEPRMNGDDSPTQFVVSPEEIAEKVIANSYLTPDQIGEHLYEEKCTGERNFYGGLNDSVCGAADTTLAIDAQGNVFPCVSFTLSAGNILETPLRKIWLESPLMNKVRGVTYGQFAENGCASCSDQKTCHPCQAYAYVETGDHLGCASSSKANAKVYQAHWDLLKERGTLQ